MIHAIARDLEVVLAASGCPFKVIDGPEATMTTTFARERIVLEHDGEDSFGPPRSQHINPRHRRTRGIGVKVTIYAQAPQAGALPFEHRRRAEVVVDQVLVALDIVAAVRRNAWRPTGGRFVQPADLERSEAIGGSVYELTLTFDRGVPMKTWAGAIRPEFALDASRLVSATRVSLSHGADDDNDDTTIPASAETACGA